MFLVRKYTSHFKTKLQEANKMTTHQATQIPQTQTIPLLPPLPTLPILPQRQLFLPLHQPLPLLQLPLGIRNHVPTHRYHMLPRICPCHFLQRSAYHVN